MAPHFCFAPGVQSYGRARRWRKVPQSERIRLARWLRRRKGALHGHRTQSLNGHFRFMALCRRYAKLRGPLSPAERAWIAKDALAYSKANKLSYGHDVARMETLLGWFREYPAEGISAQDIERRFEQEDWSPATMNRYRALLSLTYRLAIRNDKAKENPARQVKHHFENNARIRFLSPEEEAKLRTVIMAACPERIAELDLALHTGMRMSEQYRLRWQDVSFTPRSLTILRSKNGSASHISLNKTALAALESLKTRTGGSEFVCGGAIKPRPWFEPAVKAAGLSAFSWHCLRHTFASRLVMAGVDIRTVQELMGHETIAMTVRYAHLAPKHTLAAVERLDAQTGDPIDTTTDTSGPRLRRAEVVILQQSA